MKPLGDYIIFEEVIEKEKKTKSGIILATDKGNFRVKPVSNGGKIGLVKSIGSQVKQVKIGNKILYNELRTKNDYGIRRIHERNVAGIIKE